MRHFRQTHASYQCAKRKQQRTSVDIANHALLMSVLSTFAQWTRWQHATRNAWCFQSVCASSRLQLKCDGRRWRTGGEVKGKMANGVGSQYSTHYFGTWCIQHYYRWCAHLGCQQSTEHARADLKWTRPFRLKTKSGLCACAITFQTQSTVCRSYQTAVQFFPSVGSSPPPRHTKQAPTMRRSSLDLWFVTESRIILLLVFVMWVSLSPGLVRILCILWQVFLSLISWIVNTSYLLRHRQIWARTQGEGRPFNELRRDILSGRFIPNCWTVLT